MILYPRSTLIGLEMEKLEQVPLEMAGKINNENIPNSPPIAIPIGQAAAFITLHLLTGHSNSHSQFPAQCGYLSLS